jgi:heme/copper-type cytochrome/quinol oxidase subunit 1
MRGTDKLSQAQRVVVVVALGLALGTLAGYLTSLGGGPDFGWYAYAPLAAQSFEPHAGLSGWLRLIIWLAVIGLWALASLRVLRPRPEPEE